MNVVVNAATSVDGKLSSRERRQVAISGDDDFERVDALRADADAVMVGVGTVLADDPSLTVRSDERVAAREGRGESAQPARVVADSRARTPPDAAVVDDSAQTYVLVGADAPGDRRARLGTDTTEVVEAGGERVDLAAGLDALESRGVSELMVEGGGELVFSLFDAGLVDELTVYVGSKVIGGRDAPTLADGDGFREPDFVDLELEDVDRVDDGVLLAYDVEDANE
ncbi:2,5-diamino-6-(ribosylamino)-4(3H)-pyrimidinone 5'-phosphate reductase [Halorubellus sp. JP-L1]|uniref:2,5-diamino-6-(ribosylamino)-4(3H)-pyrimidinone 5'-phosphate reductase n=1 Tax=Halorubellus sp. JP-L1 TaxID=2715753 RepID=UPI00140B01CE|nr:2,5-diamino-6-(ribosylamino)-4(3H)-pyrimidinone 5'-phosphate reductase [Halorubellus sp. JP-L1]NHN40882.1 2,5-diamino-6-(ribosylamino)-4(3H)-pyrimidinone 5'-phosphate reductase [Halorubellus sp. JP-L1]